MWMGKKKTINLIIKALREQQADYGDLASINDMIAIIERLK